MNRREVWEVVLAVVSVIGALVFAGVTAVTEVTVPLLWPSAATVAAVWLGIRELDWRLQQRRQNLDRNDQGQASQALRRMRDHRTHAAILHAGRYRSDIDDRRIGDAERDVVVSVLHAHFSAGRLDQDELETRLARALAAKTVHDLRRTVWDLPNQEIDL